MKRNKILVLIIILLVAIGVVFGFIYNDRKAKNGDNSNKTYTLKKYSDFDGDLRQVLYVNFKNNYIAISSYNHLKHAFYVLKDGKVLNIPESIANAEVREIKNSDYYYTFSKGNIKLFTLETINDKLNEFDDIDFLDNGILIVSKNNKYGLMHTNGKYITDYIYDNTNEVFADKKTNYLFVEKDGKIGVINFDGDTIIPLEYEYQIERMRAGDWKNFGNYFTHNNSIYFILKKDNEYYVVNDKNEVILKSEIKITYDKELQYLEIVDKNKLEFYSLDGKLINSINYGNDWIDDSENTSDTIGNTKYKYFISKSDEKSIYIIDDKLNEKKLENVFFEEVSGEDEDCDEYYFTDNYYIKQENGKFIQYSLDNNAKLNEFTFIKNIVLRNSTNKLKYDNVILACKEEDKCGIISTKGDAIYDFKYSIPKIDYSGLDFIEGVLKSGKEKLIITTGNDIKKVVCDNDLKQADFYRVFSNTFTLDNNLYDSNCEKINDKEIRNYTEEDNYIVAEIAESVSDKYYYDYDIFDSDGKKINYQNPDNAKLKKYIGINDNKIYFLTDMGIYYVTN